MKIKLKDLNLLTSNQVSREPPQWFTQDLEFDFPIQVRAGNIVLVGDYGKQTVVVVSVWESSTPRPNEERVGEVYFINEGTEQVPTILSKARLIESQRGSIVERIAKDLIELQREYEEEGRVTVSHKVDKAKDFIRKFSYEKVATFPNDDLSILDEAKRQLKMGKAIVVVAYFDRQEYELYSHDF